MSARRVGRAALVGAAIAAGGPLGVLAASEWVRRRGAPFVVERLDRPRDCAIVLGAPVRAGRGGDEPGLSLRDRLELGAELFEAGLVRRILASCNARQAGVMARWLEDRGVPADAVIVDPLGVRTLETMRRARADYGLRDVVVCTHRSHLPRSLMLARHHGLDAVGVAADRGHRFSRKPFREVLARCRALLDVARDGHLADGSLGGRVDRRRVKGDS